MPTLVAGSQFAGYRIESVAGRGGMGVVYRATQLGLGRLVALKLIAVDLAEDLSFRERFKRESQITASIDHPNVIPVYEAGEVEGTLFIAMRYVEGSDLKAMIQREGGLEPQRAVRIMGQVAAALEAAHRRGLVHRDVKPANVLITGDDDDEHAYLTDFGLTKQTSSDSGGLTATGAFVGTLDYVAPEQIKGEVSDGRADVYALGCVLFHTVTGKVPYDRPSDVAKMYAHLNDPAPAPSSLSADVPASLDDVIATAMAKEPADRYQSAAAFRSAALRAIGGSSTPTAPRPLPEETIVAPRAAPPLAVEDEAPTAARPEPPAAGRRSRGPLLALGALVAAAVVAGVLVLGGGSDKKKETPKVASAPDKQAPPKTVPQIVAQIPVGRRPDGIAVADGRVFVTNSQDGTMSVIDPKTNTVDGKIDVGRDPDGVVGAKGVVWVAAARDDTVHRLIAKGKPIPNGIIKVGDDPEGISLGKQLVWVANIKDDTVLRLDRASPRALTPPIGVGDRPTGIFVGPHGVWVTNNGDDTVTRIDSATSEVMGDPIPVGKEPRGVVEGTDAVWVANSGDGTVTRIESKTGKVVAKAIQVGRNPREIAVGFGFVWVSLHDDNAVVRIDPKTNRVTGSPIPVGNQPLGIAAGAGAVWVNSYKDDSVTRIKP